MTCLSFLRDDQTPLVLDTSVLINLHECSYGEAILKAIPNDIYVPKVVVDELNSENRHAKDNNEFIERLNSQRTVKVIELDKNSLQTYESLVTGDGSLDDGEAATIAIAATMKFLPVIDERKGRMSATKLIRGRIVAWSLDVIAHPDVKATLSADEFIEAIYFALRDGRMRITEQSCDAVVALIGVERALECSCLPGFKDRCSDWRKMIDNRKT